MSFMIISLIVCLFLNLIISFVIQALIPNYYLAQIITSLVISFIFALFITSEKKSFYKNRTFWIYFLGTSLVFLLIDCLSFTLL